jgi:hypothetical protein
MLLFGLTFFLVFCLLSILLLAFHRFDPSVRDAACTQSLFPFTDNGLREKGPNTFQRSTGPPGTLSAIAGMRISTEISRHRHQAVDTDHSCGAPVSQGCPLF